MIREALRTGFRAGLRWIYAKRDYKLFLREALPETMLRTLRLASLTDHFAVSVRPISIRAPFGRSVVVVAPHQDDEAIGCGGALALQVASGGAAHVVILQDGADGHDVLGMTREAMRNLRNAESAKAAAIAGIGTTFLNHSDLAESREVAAKGVLDLLITRRADVVFTPWLLDAHVDHQLANRILADALAQVPWPVRVLCYEVWGLCIPNVVVSIDSVIDIKRSMLEAFAFANGAVDYTNSTIGLSMYRTRLLGAGEARHLEAFTEMPASEFIALERRLRESVSAQ